MSELKDARMEVPPIPKGSVYFSTSPAHGSVFNLRPLGQVVPLTTDDDGYWRPLITAIGVYEWRLTEKFWQQQYDKIWGDTKEPEALSSVQIAALGAAEAQQQNAREAQKQWEAWGAQ